MHWGIYFLYLNASRLILDPEIHHLPLPLYAINVVVLASAPVTAAPDAVDSAFSLAVTSVTDVRPSSDIKYAARPATWGDAIRC